MAVGKYDKQFVTDLKADIPATKWHPKVQPVQKGKNGRILYMDSDLVPGAFYNECVWIYNASGDVQKQGGIQAHSHDHDEVLGFFGTNLEDPYDLGAEIEFWLGDEKNILTRTCLIFIPKGLKHCPLRVLKVKTPVFHFSAHAGKEYTHRNNIIAEPAKS